MSKKVSVLIEVEEIGKSEYAARIGTGQRLEFAPDRYIYTTPKAAARGASKRAALEIEEAFNATTSAGTDRRDPVSSQPQS